jgi:hypothetical protein
MLKSTRRPDGSIEMRRPKYEPGPYTVSSRELATLRDLGMSYEEATHSREGYLQSWRELERFERGGRQWVLLQRPMYEYAVEIELKSDGDIGEVVPVQPERAFELAKQHGDPRTIQE